MTAHYCHECGTMLATDADALDVGPLRINFAARTVYWRGIRVHLKPKEFDVLALLVNRRDKVIQLWVFDAVGILPDESSSNLLDVYICHINRKFREADPAFASIERIRGVGLRWNSVREAIAA